MSSAALLPAEGEVTKCACNCHANKTNGLKLQERVLSPTNEYVTSVLNADDEVSPKDNHANVGTQTLSTGEIVVTKIYFNESGE